MTQAPEIARPDTSAETAPTAAALAHAQMYLDGHITGLEGREDEFSRAIIDVIRTLTHTKGYPHQVNDALAKSWLSSIRFARQHGLMQDYIDDSVELMRPILERMGKVVAESGQKDVALECICGWSTCHHQLVTTETYKAPGKRWFLSPFTTTLDAGRRIGQFDFDEAYVVDEYWAPRARGFAKVLGVNVHVEPFDPATRMITISLVD
jgi:hypothetical protein